MVHSNPSLCWSHCTWPLGPRYVPNWAQDSCMAQGSSGKVGDRDGLRPEGCPCVGILRGLYLLLGRQGASVSGEE